MKLLTAATAFVLAVSSVSAANSPKVQACAEAIETAGDQFAVVDDGFYNWKAADGISGFSAVQTEEDKVEENVQEAINACSAVESPITAEEADFIIGKLRHHASRITSTLHTVIYRHDDIAKDPEVTSHVTNDLQKLNGLNDKLKSSLVAMTPETHLSQTKNPIAKMDTAFESAYSKYGLK